MEQFEFDPLYMVAVMKVQHDLGGGRFRGFENLLGRTLIELGIEPAEFDHYLDRHRESLSRMVAEVGI